jgi:hypothetical protein
MRKRYSVFYFSLWVDDMKRNHTRSPLAFIIVGLLFVTPPKTALSQEQPSSEEVAVCASVALAPYSQAVTFISATTACRSGKLQGSGTLTYSYRSGRQTVTCTFGGTWVDGKLEGDGSDDCAGKTKFRGIFVGGMRNGPGVTVSEDLSRLLGLGTFRNGSMTSGFAMSDRAGTSQISSWVAAVVRPTGQRAVCTSGATLIPSIGCTEADLSFVREKLVMYSRVGAQGISRGVLTTPEQQAAEQARMAAAENARVQALETEARRVAYQNTPPIDCDALFTSRTTTLPSEALAKFAVCSSISQYLGSTQFRINNFAKIDGQRSERLGVAHYTMFVRYEVEYTGDMKPECFTSESANRQNRIDGGCLSELSVGGISVGGTRRLPLAMPAGFRRQITDEIEFSMFESGWKYSTISYGVTVR